MLGCCRPGSAARGLGDFGLVSSPPGLLPHVPDTWARRQEEPPEGCDTYTSSGALAVLTLKVRAGSQECGFFFVYVYARVCLHARTHTHAYTCAHRHAHAHTHACTCTRAHTHTHTGMHVHTEQVTDLSSLGTFGPHLLPPWLFQSPAQLGDSGAMSCAVKLHLTLDEVCMWPCVCRNTGKATSWLNLEARGVGHGLVPSLWSHGRRDGGPLCVTPSHARHEGCCR